METLRMIMDWVTLGLYVLWMVLAMRAYFKNHLFVLLVAVGNTIWYTNMKV